MKRLEWLFHIIAFALQCGGIVPVFLRTGDDSADLGAANPLNTIFTAFVLTVTLVLLLRNARTASDAAHRRSKARSSPGCR